MGNHIRFMIMAALLAALPLQAQSVRTWVSTAGSDANPCSRALPCRNFAAAVSAVAPGGEVVVVDSGGYGPVTITKSVSLIAPATVHAAIAPTSDSAVTINAAASDVVILRGLYLNSQGADNGVDAWVMDSLHIERTVISGFGFVNVNFAPLDIPAMLYVSRSTIRGAHDGIAVQGSTVIADAVISRTMLVGSPDSDGCGIHGRLRARLTVVDSTVSGWGNGSGICGSNCVITADKVLAVNGGIGVEGMTDTTIRIGNSVVTNNTVEGLLFFDANILSRSDNTIEGNGGNQDPSDTFNPQ